MTRFLTICMSVMLLCSCSSESEESPSLPLSKTFSYRGGQLPAPCLHIDSLDFATRPRNVLLTKNDQHRLAPVYKVLYNKRTKHPYISDNQFHGAHAYYGSLLEKPDAPGQNWHHHLMPGFEVLYGYYLVNVSHYNYTAQSQQAFFDHSVVIHNLYYPAFSQDTLNGQPVTRQFYMVSVYDEDTNQDSLIDKSDLRRLYHLDLEAKTKTPLVPLNYSVKSSTYDPANDFMYVFADLDENNNGQPDVNEPTHIFWIDLKDPNQRGIQYKHP